MKAIYIDFKNGLRDVTIADVIAEYNFAKENHLEFTIPALTLAAGEIKKVGTFEKFEEVYNSSELNESVLFRSVAKLQNQIKRRVEEEEKILNRMVEDCQSILDGNQDDEEEIEENEYNNDFINNSNYYKEKLEKIGESK